MVAIFALGYIGIIFEEIFEFNKAAVALLMSTALWVTYADFFQSTGVATGGVLDQLKEQVRGERTVQGERFFFFIIIIIFFFLPRPSLRPRSWPKCLTYASSFSPPPP